MRSLQDRWLPVLGLSSPDPGSIWARWSSGAVYVLLLLALSMYLPMARRVRRFQYQCCANCLYDLRQIPGDTCPECGRTFDRTKFREQWVWWVW